MWCGGEDLQESNSLVRLFERCVGVFIVGVHGSLRVLEASRERRTVDDEVKAEKKTKSRSVAMFCCTLGRNPWKGNGRGFHFVNICNKAEAKHKMNMRQS